MSNVNIDTISKENFKELCRTCSANTNLNQLYKNIEITSMLESCTQMQFTKGDELPDKICTKCINKLKEVYHFINTCKKTDETYRKCLIINEQQDAPPIAECFIKQEYNIHFMADESTTTETTPINVETSNNTKTIKRRIYTCDVCNKTFNYSSNLIAHKRVHTGETPFTCGICLKTFTTSSSLIRHRRIHSGEHPYKCDVCAKEFKQSSNFMLHKRIHTGERPYKCDTCHEDFIRSSDLRTHERIHSGERPYECDVCGKAFTQSSALIVHKRLHSGVKPYQCKICSKQFTHLGSIKKHENVHNKVLPKIEPSTCQ